MAIRQVINVTGVSASNPVPLERWLAGPVLLGTKVSGTVLYTVQHTFDDPFQVGGLTNATWYNHDNAVMTSATANASDNFMAAPTALRLVNHATTTGEVILTIVQDGGFPT